MRVTIEISEKAVLPLALSIKESMGIEQFIPFRNMNLAERQEWIRKADSISPGVLLKEIPKFSHKVQIDD